MANITDRTPGASRPVRLLNTKLPDSILRNLSTQEREATATDFSFFERSLSEKRIYRVTRDWERDLVKDLSASGKVDILEDAEEHTLVRVTHLMNPGTPDGARPIEKRFGVKLPAEVHEFYRRWNGGILIYRSLYSILAVLSIAEVAVAHASFL